ncbi:MAG: IS1182 family transposase [Deltaproteobacteria bacterium]|nr:IS1182 family transposase [Deltaproteobacteria bacterium]
MAYRYGDRYQMELMPQSIEEYVSKDNPVRAYDAFVEALNFRELGIELNPGKVGNSEYDPVSMFKLLVYGYSYGVKSSRKLERECHHNIAFIWLMGGLKPDHKTIAEFRRKNKSALRKVLRQSALVCIDLNLITGNVLFVDGTKIRANASRSKSYQRKYYQRLLRELDERVDQLLRDCETADRREEGMGSYVTMDQELSKTQTLKERIKEILDINKDVVNQTDPDCAIMHSPQGNHASHNVQIVVDDENGLILNAEAVGDTNDSKQFARQIDQANEILPTPCQTACADAGYANTQELVKIDQQNIKVVVPTQRQALHEEPRPFGKDCFTYDAKQDCYICPEGHKLRYSHTYTVNRRRQYRMEDKKHCHNCKHYGECTTSERGRNLVRLPNEETKEKLEAQYLETASQEIYARRKMRVEHPFGHIKRNLKTDAFLLRGRKGVQAETSILATCFNIARMITIFGVDVLINKLRFRTSARACC